MRKHSISDFLDREKDYWLHYKAHFGGKSLGFCSSIYNNHEKSTDSGQVSRVRQVECLVHWDSIGGNGEEWGLEGSGGGGTNRSQRKVSEDPNLIPTCVHTLATFFTCQKVPDNYLGLRYWASLQRFIGNVLHSGQFSSSDIISPKKKMLLY